MPSISFGCIPVPVDLLPAVNLMAFPDIPPYLAYFGFDAETALKWRDAGTVRLEVQLVHHSEQGGHTWYSIRCALSADNASDRQEWTVNRRLEHIRSHLYDRVREDLGPETYEQRFAALPFARRFGLPGTSTRVGAWLSALAGHVSAGRVPPTLAAQFLRFLAAPEGPMSTAGATSPASGAVASWAANSPSGSTIGSQIDSACGPAQPMIGKDLDNDGAKLGLASNRHEVDISTFKPNGLSTGGRRGGC